ncbi:thioredoxin domain-containing protein [Sediminitomix flava]|uniref:Thioredoxin n=1 Tax=Sediminitomix flava TaxID=379075 RepID=A0A315ZFX9_SEDFL|nr:thioredoxin domain-containing protein [Sediminitomix flava]PWJ44040.1 thioredoxin [Sediminitomix flava]
MKLLILKFSLIFLLLSSCSDAQTQADFQHLDAKSFQTALANAKDAQLIDVRTPEEVAKGTIENAKNINWFDNFNEQAKQLDTSKPVYLYCRSGARSTKAAKRLVSLGFEEVYELDGGLGKWMAADFPVVRPAQKDALSMADFQKMIDSDKLVLVDFYAEWCGPCKKMAPYLAEIKKDHADKVVVVKIDADANPELCKEFNITALPVLQLYDKKEKTWEHLGYIDKEGVMEKLGL